MPTILSGSAGFGVGDGSAVAAGLVVAVEGTAVGGRAVGARVGGFVAMAVGGESGVAVDIAEAVAVCVGDGTEVAVAAAVVGAGDVGLGSGDGVGMATATVVGVSTDRAVGATASGSPPHPARIERAATLAHSATARIIRIVYQTFARRWAALRVASPSFYLATWSFSLSTRSQSIS